MTLLEFLKNRKAVCKHFNKNTRCTSTLARISMDIPEIMRKTTENRVVQAILRDWNRYLKIYAIQKRYILWLTCERARVLTIISRLETQSNTQTRLRSSSTLRNSRNPLLASARMRAQNTRQTQSRASTQQIHHHTTNCNNSEAKDRSTQRATSPRLDVQMNALRT